MSPAEVRKAARLLDDLDLYKGLIAKSHTHGALLQIEGQGVVLPAGSWGGLVFDHLADPTARRLKALGVDPATVTP